MTRTRVFPAQTLAAAPKCTRMTIPPKWTVGHPKPGTGQLGGWSERQVARPRYLPSRRSASSISASDLQKAKRSTPLGAGQVR